MSIHTIGSIGEISHNVTRIKKEPKQERFEEKDTPLNIIACKITPFISDPEENLHIFLRFNNIKYQISDEMKPLWPYGRVIITSAGFNGEFRRDNDEFMSLLFLGKEKNDALKIMSRIVEQNIEINNKKKIFFRLKQNK